MRLEGGQRERSWVDAGPPFSGFSDTLVKVLARVHLGRVPERAAPLATAQASDRLEAASLVYSHFVYAFLF